MDCKEFSQIMGEYVNRTLDADAAKAADAHTDACSECAARMRELACTSAMIRSLARANTPDGFEAQVRARIADQCAAQQSGFWFTVQERLQSLGRLLWGTPGHRLSVGPALAALMLCVVAAGSLYVFAPNHKTPAPETDWAYINTVKDQHASYAGSNPLGDESAAALRESTSESGETM